MAFARRFRGRGKERKTRKDSRVTRRLINGNFAPDPLNPASAPIAVREQCGQEALMPSRGQSARKRPNPLASLNANGEQMIKIVSTSSAMRTYKISKRGPGLANGACSIVLAIVGLIASHVVAYRLW